MNRIDELRRIYSDIERLQDDYKRLSMPMVMNMGMIHNLFEVFKMTLSRLDNEADPLDTSNRKKFLYAILYIFSPATIMSGVMRHKLRESVSTVLRCTPSGVSRDYKTSIFFYSTYKGFKDSVDIIIRDMLSILGMESER